MNSKNLDKLKKLLMMTTSDNDHEALQAMRGANKVLASENLTWEQFCKGRIISVTEAPPEPPEREISEDEFVQAAVIVANADIHGSFERMCASIIDQWNRGKKLTKRQKEIIVDAADRELGRTRSSSA